VVIGALFAERANIASYIQQVGFPAIVLNLVTMAVAFLTARFLLLPASQRSAITLECGLQNSTLGLAVALTILDRPDISIPIAVYGLLMLFTGFGFAMWTRQRNE
jgi:BASS family bile acid:Na+ symporter